MIFEVTCVPYHAVIGSRREDSVVSCLRKVKGKPGAQCSLNCRPGDNEANHECHLRETRSRIGLWNSG